jgi:hypothetical protein
MTLASRVGDRIDQHLAVAADADQMKQADHQIAVGFAQAAAHDAVDQQAAHILRAGAIQALLKLGPADGRMGKQLIENGASIRR